MVGYVAHIDWISNNIDIRLIRHGHTSTRSISVASRFSVIVYVCLRRNLSDCWWDMHNSHIHKISWFWNSIAAHWPTKDISHPIDLWSNRNNCLLHGIVTSYLPWFLFLLIIVIGMAIANSDFPYKNCTDFLNQRCRLLVWCRLLTDRYDIRPSWSPRRFSFDVTANACPA